MERHARRPRPRLDRLSAALIAVLLGAFGLRVWGIGHGLPFSYNIDEEGHFVPVAIGFFGHGLDPRYFLNPPGYTELLYVVYALWFGGREEVARAYVDHPSEVFLVARVTVALLGTLWVWLTHVLGSRLFGDRRVGVLAAALGAVAFLPVFYSHLALNDVPSLAPATLALVCAALILSGRGRAGGIWWLLLGGLAVGLAAGTKYTAGIVLLPLLTAVAIRTREERQGVAHLLAAAALAGFATLVGFLIANPHALLSYHDFRAGVGRQRELAGGDELAKLGLTAGQRRPLLPLDVHLGARLDPGAAGARRGGAGLLQAARGRARAAADGRRLPALHGHAGPLLRPLAAAAVPDRLRAGGVVPAVAAAAGRRAAGRAPRCR